MNSERESLTRAIGTIGLAAGIINVMIGVFATAAVSSVMASSIAELLSLPGRAMHALILVAAFTF